MLFVFCLASFFRSLFFVAIRCADGGYHRFHSLSITWSPSVSVSIACSFNYTLKRLVFRIANAAGLLRSLVPCFPAVQKVIISLTQSQRLNSCTNGWYKKMRKPRHKQCSEKIQKSNTIDGSIWSKNAWNRIELKHNQFTAASPLAVFCARQTMLQTVRTMHGLVESHLMPMMIKSKSERILPNSARQKKKGNRQQRKLQQSEKPAKKVQDLRVNSSKCNRFPVAFFHSFHCSRSCSVLAFVIANLFVLRQLHSHLIRFSEHLLLFKPQLHSWFAQ